MTALMTIPATTRGTLKQQLNRFAALVDIDGIPTTMHVHDPGAKSTLKH